ncbi:hypothetical protein J6590_080211 [Homalodisca vitripennis]|nr:hypothetical protein J6590_080211 [Homalodisca vitripennis]
MYKVSSFTQSHWVPPWVWGLPFELVWHSVRADGSTFFFKFLHSHKAHKRQFEFHEFMSRAKDITKWLQLLCLTHNCERTLTRISSLLHDLPGLSQSQNKLRHH